MYINTDLIRKALADQGIKQEIAAERCGMPTGTFAGALKRGSCSARTLGKLAKGLNLPVWELVKR